MNFVYAVAGLLVVSLPGLQALKYADNQETKSTWQTLAGFAESSPQFFVSEVDGGNYFGTEDSFPFLASKQNSA